MPWWGWVLIIVGIIGVGFLKLKLFSQMKGKSKKTHHEDED